MTHETIQIGFLSARPRIEFKENQNVLKAKDQEKVDMEAAENRNNKQGAELPQGSGPPPVFTSLYPGSQ